MPKKYEIMKTCPPDLRALIEKLGTKAAVVKALGVAKETVNRWEKGQTITPEFQARMERALSGTGAREVEVPVPEVVFKPWDGTRRSVTLPARGKGKPKIFKNVPSWVADLFEKHEGNVSKSARAMGATGNTMMVLLTGKVPFDDARQRKVFEGLHSVPSQSVEEEGPDQFLLDMAIVQVPSKNYDRVSDVVDLLNGRRLFRTNTSVGWLVVYRIKGEDALRKFKRIASRDCSKITCP